MNIQLIDRYLYTVIIANHWTFLYVKKTNETTIIKHSFNHIYLVFLHFVNTEQLTSTHKISQIASVEYIYIYIYYHEVTKTKTYIDNTAIYVKNNTFIIVPLIQSKKATHIDIYIYNIASYFDILQFTKQH